MTLLVLEASPPQVRYIPLSLEVTNVLLKTWKTESRKPTKGKVDWSLGRTPHHPHCCEMGGNKSLDSSRQSKESPGRTVDTDPQEDLRVSFQKSWHILSITLTPCYGELIPFKQDENIWVYLAKKNVLNISDFCFRGNLCWTNVHVTSCRSLYPPGKPSELFCFHISIRPYLLWYL